MHTHLMKDGVLTMREVERIDRILENFSNIWKAYPDLRFGQLVVILYKKADIFGVEDSEFEKILEIKVKRWLKDE